MTSRARYIALATAVSIGLTAFHQFPTNGFMVIFAGIFLAMPSAAGALFIKGAQGLGAYKWQSAILIALHALILIGERSI